jgi:propionyl-CoA carboxylase beta chain
MGVEGAVNIIFRDRLAEAEDPDAERARLVAEYQERLANPYLAAERGYVDEVILPSETRARVAVALGLLENKRQSVPAKKHGNIPL